MISDGVALTWETVRARSLAGNTYCADCYFMFRSGGVPCAKHTLESEREARDEVMREADREFMRIWVRR